MQCTILNIKLKYASKPVTMDTIDIQDITPVVIIELCFKQNDKTVVLGR